jgi:hypothetical protein
MADGRENHMVLSAEVNNGFPMIVDRSTRCWSKVFWSVSEPLLQGVAHPWISLFTTETLLCLGLGWHFLMVLLTRHSSWFGVDAAFQWSMGSIRAA